MAMVCVHTRCKRRNPGPGWDHPGTRRSLGGGGAGEDDTDNKRPPLRPGGWSPLEEEAAAASPDIDAAANQEDR